MSYRTDPESIILQTVFGDHSANRCWLLMNWALLQENGNISLETVLDQTRAVISAVALKRILAEFYNRMTECGNDIGSLDVISALDELDIGEEAVWFLAGQESAEDNELLDILNSRDDIHDMLDYLVRREGRAEAELMEQAFGSTMLFAQMLATAVRSDGEELDGYDSAEEYRDAVEACFGEMNNFTVDYAACYEWINNGMEL